MNGTQLAVDNFKSRKTGVEVLNLAGAEVFAVYSSTQAVCAAECVCLILRGWTPSCKRLDGGNFPGPGQIESDGCGWYFARIDAAYRSRNALESRVFELWLYTTAHTMLALQEKEKQHFHLRKRVAAHLNYYWRRIQRKLSAFLAA